MQTMEPGLYEGRITTKTREYLTIDGVWFAPWAGGCARAADAFTELYRIDRVKEPGERAFLAYVAALVDGPQVYVGEPKWDCLGAPLKAVWAKVEEKVTEYARETIAAE